jgi:hypothetical protein
MKRFAKRCVLLTAICLLLSCTERQEGIRIAAPDDYCGVLAHYLVKNKELTNAEFAGEVFPLMDCCSTTTEWAMSADEIDVAWLCPDAAQNLLKKDSRFLILGPSLVNSQVLVIREGGNPKRIAYSHKQEYQKALIQKRFGMDCEAIPVTPTALPYLYEKGSVDGVVVDVLKSLTIKGRHLHLSDDGADVINYVLVVSKAFRGSEIFPQFISALQNSTAKLNDIDVLTKILGEGKKIAPAQVRQIGSQSVRFVLPQNH